MLQAALPDRADITDNPDPLVFPESRDEAVAALDQFLEEFRDQFQRHYGMQPYRWYRGIDEREAHRHWFSSAPPHQDPPL